MKTIHKLCEIFPIMQDDEFKNLVSDIKDNGLLEPIFLFNDEIIDGRNRYLACIEAGVEPKFQDWNGQGSVLTFVLSQNLHRRHLSATQRACIAQTLLPMLEAEAKIRQGYESVSVVPILGQLKQIDKSSKIVAKELSVSHSYVSDVKAVVARAPELLDKMLNGSLTISDAKTIYKQPKEQRELIVQRKIENPTEPIVKSWQAVAREKIPEPAITPPTPNGKFNTIVVDPPWEMKKIQRDLRPDQGHELDYPTMTLDEIRELPIDSLADEKCHLYLWTTHKYLPDALELIKAWNFKYQCLMTWVKPSGMTPYSWMYDTEHVIYAHRGGQKLLEMGLKLSIIADATGHSKKPDEFYQRIEKASPSPRLDMFARKSRDGWTSYGNEVESDEQ